MKCDEVRNLIRDADHPPSQETFGHLDTCPACQEWLTAEIDRPPAEFPAPCWVEAPVRVGVRVIPPEESWLSAWVKNLVAGMTLAAAVAVMFLAVVRVLPGPQPVERPEARQEFSFLPEQPSLQEIRFLEPLPREPFLSQEMAEATSAADGEQEGPSFVSEVDSQESWSFLEPGAPLTFLESEQEEESS